MAYDYSTASDAPTANERPMLEAFLDHHRDALVAKVRGVSEAHARRRLVASMTTLAGLVHHLRRVEASWFEHRLAQGDINDIPVLAWFFEDPDQRDFWIPPDETVDQALTAYEEQCERSRRIASSHELNDLVPHPEMGTISMRSLSVILGVAG